MTRGPVRSAALCLLLSLSVWAGSKIYVLKSLTPVVDKKSGPGYTMEGLTSHFRDQRADVQVTVLTPEERTKFFAGKGLDDPFTILSPRENYIFFKLRMENLDSSDTLEFSPNEVMFGNSMPLDETMLYQLLYKEKDGDAKLVAAGKTVFSRHLSLPPHAWIERLIIFQYDDPYPARKISLVINGAQIGRNGLELEFLFKSDFKKE